jgi:hypothetical protein
VAVAIVPADGAAPTELKRWVADDHDVRNDAEIAAAIGAFADEHGAKTIVVADRIIGCPRGGRSAFGHPGYGGTGFTPSPFELRRCRRRAGLPSRSSTEVRIEPKLSEGWWT